MPHYSLDIAIQSYDNFTSLYDIRLENTGIEDDYSEYLKEVERRRLSRLYAEVKDNIAKRSNLDYITSPLLTNKEDKLLQNIENRFINVHGIKKEDLGEMYTYGKRAPIKDKFNVNYDPVFRRDNRNTEYYKMPKDEDEFFAKYGENAQEKWDNPKTLEELEDRFGEEFFDLSDKEIKERYGEDILDTYEDAKDEILEEIEEEREKNKTNVIKEKEVTLKNDNNKILIDKEDLAKEDIKIDVMKENDDSLEDDEYSLGENAIEDDNNNDIEYKENTQRTAPEDDESIEDEWADDEWAEYIYDKFKSVLYKKQIVGEKRIFHRGNTPSTIDLVKNQEKSIGEIFDEYEKEQQKTDPDFKIDNNPKTFISSHLYEAQTADYKKGVIKKDDEERLKQCAGFIDEIKKQHADHGIGYIFRHPINYFTEWNVLRKMNNELKAIGFTQAEIDAKVNESHNSLNDITINKEENKVDKSISDIKTVNTIDLKTQKEFTNQNDLTNQLIEDVGLDKTNKVINTNKVKDDPNLDKSIDDINIKINK